MEVFSKKKKKKNIGSTPLLIKLTPHDSQQSRKILHCFINSKSKVKDFTTKLLMGDFLQIVLKKKHLSAIDGMETCTQQKQD